MQYIATYAYAGCPYHRARGSVALY